jgi:3-methylfumaryl-CoA hydratase
MMNEAAADPASWIGRTEEARDVVTASPLDRLAATLDRDGPPFRDGDPVPPLAHWLFFLPRDPLSVTGPDGHRKRGGFLPPIHHLPRRMWAGSRIAFPGDIRVGDRIVRRSTVASVTEKSGASGPLVFVTVRHEIGRDDAPPAIVDEHDIVYRSVEGAAVKRAGEKAEPGAWRRTLIPDSVLLFRYSALTFNSHRIHYDRDYVTKVEGYPGLVVHGPLVATLLIDLVRRNAPDARIESFTFRAASPLFDGNEMSVNGTPPGADGIARLWAANAAGETALAGEAMLSGYRRAQRKGS